MEKWVGLWSWTELLGCSHVWISTYKSLGGGGGCFEELKVKLLSEFSSDQKQTKSKNRQGSHDKQINISTDSRVATKHIFEMEMFSCLHLKLQQNNGISLRKEALIKYWYFPNP